MGTLKSISRFKLAMGNTNPSRSTYEPTVITTVPRATANQHTNRCGRRAADSCSKQLPGTLPMKHSVIQDLFIEKQNRLEDILLR